MKKLPGVHLTGDFYNVDCDRKWMVDAALLEKKCKQLVDCSNLTTVGSLFHQFGEDGGVTGAIILAESHFTIHCWPEKNYVTIDVFVCNYTTDNRIKARSLYDAVEFLFNPKYAKFNSIDRE